MAASGLWITELNYWNNPPNRVWGQSLSAIAASHILS